MTQRLDSQCTRILRHLKSGKSLTPLDGLKIAGSWRLSGRILELRRAGHNIVTIIEHRNGKHYARYKLAKGRRAA